MFGWQKGNLTLIPVAHSGKLKLGRRGAGHGTSVRYSPRRCRMLVLSREPGTSIHVGSSDETCVVTVLTLLPNRRAVAMLINRTSAALPGQLDTRSVELPVDAVLKISDSAEVTLVDLREDKARIGINAPKESSVHRLEVYEAIRRENRRGPDPEDGTAGSRVPRPSTPKPPSLDVRLDEPPPANGGGE